MQYDQRDVLIAFALVFGAGSATAFGAAVVFVPRFVKYATNRKLLASSLGLSAGVMIYVSFIEIFQKSRIAFQDAGIKDNLPYVYATCCFFAGVCIMMILNASVSYFLHIPSHHVPPVVHEPVTATASAGTASAPQHHSHHHTTSTPNTTTTRTTSSSGDPNQQQHQPIAQDTPHICCSSDDPVRDLEVLNQMADILIAEEEAEERKNKNRIMKQQPITQPVIFDAGIRNDSAHGTNEVHNDNNINHGNNNITPSGIRSSSSSNSSTTTDEENDPATLTDQEDAAAARTAHERRLLMRMSMNTAIAIGLHNFPEGLATFVATLHDPHVGFVLAIAIAIHNIPEGLCVALPVYYATGNRRTAFCWAILSGCSEPFAAVIGYIVLANSFTSITYGILFGIVSGMMVMISTRELLPTAHRYDPSDSVVSYSFIFGMALLALSLVLFAL